jgi:glutamyl-tRNA synthetase
MHVGGVRTALFAWIVAKQSDGKFILRIEDTDKERHVEGSEDHIIKTLKTLGLNYDEGPDIDGPFGPYRQSQRLEIYKEWGNKLVKMGRAYADPYTAAEVEEFRQAAKANKKPFLYRDHRPTDPPKWDGSMPLRFLSEPKSYSWHDEIMGDLSTSEEVVDDFILIKTDGYPTYNFSHIVDDHLMEISLIIRAQEFLASVPRYLNLYEALNIEHPKFATVPFVLAANGKKKLSKRDGAKDILEYIKEGYLVSGLINFIASLGWNDGSEQEIFSTGELIEKFKLSDVQKSGAKFDEQRLLWMNGAHIRGLDLDSLYKLSLDFWPASSSSYPDDYKKRVLALIQERLKILSEIPSLTNFFFEDLEINPSLIDDHKKLKDINHDQLKDWLTQARKVLEESDFALEDITKILNDLLAQTNQKPVVLFSLIRIATTQSPSSPGLFETLEVLGKDRVLKRIDQQIAAL